MEFDVVEEKGYGSSNVTGLTGVSVPGINMQQTVTIIDATHIVGVLMPITRITKTEEKGRDQGMEAWSRRPGPTVPAQPQAIALTVLHMETP